MSSKDDVFNYVMNSPEDTNPAVLRSLLNGIVEGAVINDDTPSTSTVYSSSKIESLIPANELPTPSVSNNGKVATVVSDGEGGYLWSAESPTGGTEYFDVTYTQATSEDTPTVNKTFTEIKSAYEAGKIIRLKWSDNTYFLDNLFKGGETLCNSAWYDDNVLDKISFLAVGYGVTSDTYYNIVVSIENADGNAWIYTTCQSYA